MNFYNYMVKNYLEEDSPKGDLARDMKSDKEDFPENTVGKFDGWKKLIRRYLIRKSSCPDCIKTFDEAWKEYEECERKRLKRPLLRK